MNDTAFAKPYEVSQVEAHDESRPYVVFMNWGQWHDWPPEHETRFQPTSFHPLLLSPASDTAPPASMGHSSVLAMSDRNGVCGQRVLVEWRSPSRDPSIPLPMPAA